MVGTPRERFYHAGAQGDSNMAAENIPFSATNDEAPGRADNWLQAVNMDLYDVMKTKDLIRTGTPARSICV